MKEKKSQLDEAVAQLDNITEDKWDETKENIANIFRRFETGTCRFEGINFLKRG